MARSVLPTGWVMRLVSPQHEAHHRGYRIEGEQKSEGFLLRVTPTRAGLPRLPWSRFRTLRASWAEAVRDVTRFIDDALVEIENRKDGKNVVMLVASILQGFL